MIFLRRFVKFIVDTPIIQNYHIHLYTRRFINQLMINYAYEASYKSIKIEHYNAVINFDVSYSNSDNPPANNKYSENLGIWSYVILSTANKYIGVEENIFNYDSQIKVVLYVRDKVTKLYEKPYYKIKNKYRLYYQNKGYLNIK